MNNQVFKGFKVVELASVLAGPAVGLFFAELGAEVVKIENKATGGDVTRRWKAPVEKVDKTDSAYYNSVNFGKTSLLLNLKSETDRQKVYDYIAEADIVLVNYRAGAAERLGMDYKHLKTINPKIIYGEITGFGATDSRLAFDVVLQAETGFLFLTGKPNEPPVKMPVALIDLLAAHQLKEGVLIALLERAKTGQGSFVTVSLYDAAIASLANQATNWLVAGYAPQPMGTQHPNIAPYGDLLETKDGKYLVLAVGVEKHFQQLCALLDLDEMAEDQRFSTNAARVKNRKELIVALQTAIGEHDREDILQQLHQTGIPAGAVRDLPDVFAQPLVQKMLVNTNNEQGQPIQCVSSVAFQLKK